MFRCKLRNSLQAKRPSFEPSNCVLKVQSHPLGAFDLGPRQAADCAENNNPSTRRINRLHGWLASRRLLSFLRRRSVVLCSPACRMIAFSRLSDALFSPVPSTIQSSATFKANLTIVTKIEKASADSNLASLVQILSLQINKFKNHFNFHKFCY